MSPLIGILIIAGIITSLQKHWVDSVAILVVVALAAGLGFWQERKAERDVRSLQRLSTTTARVWRDGSMRVVASEELVPGDLVLLESGEKVPADIRLLRSIGLQADESMLTGESVAAPKSTATAGEGAPVGDWRGVAFSGTLITRGRGNGVVVATGAHTQIGEINRLVGAAPPKTPLQVLTHRLERQIGVGVLLGVVVVVVLGIVSGYTLEEMFRVGVALSVSAIPESLPVILTVAMSVGISRLAKRGAIVRSLPAVETLGSTTVIASDKTGTLTKNRLTVERLWTATGVRAPVEPLDAATMAMLRAGGLTNEANRGSDGVLVGDAVDVAMAAAAVETGALSEEERTAKPEWHMPYESTLGFSQSVHRDRAGVRTLYVKGAPDAVAGMCDRVATDGGALPMDAALVRDANDRLAAGGLRVLATASRVLAPDEEDPADSPPTGMLFLGLMGMADPPREGVKEAIADCTRAGIAVKMVTGDHPSTAEAIALRLGMRSKAPSLTGSELRNINDAELAARLAETAVAARVSPGDKLRIVRVLQGRGEVVAVTGDGVNDAPALRAASIGVAMGRSGTEVARDAADVVLTDDDFVTIVGAVEQGRVTFAAIRKATFFLLSTAVASVLAISLNVLFDQPLIFLPIQILWINLVTSGIQDIALALEPAEGDELKRRPRSRTEGVLSRVLWVRTWITGAWMGLAVLFAFTWSLSTGATVEEARTFAMVTFVLFNVFQVGNARSESRSLFALSPFRNPLLSVTSAVAVLALWGVMSWQPSAALFGIVPLDWWQWGVAGVVAVSVLVLVESEKSVRRFVASRRSSG